MTENATNTTTQRVLITGAAGFLGSHLCDRFVRDGFQVIAMDNLITGDMRNIEHLLALPNFSFVHQDVTEYIHVSGPLHHILHFASPASPIDYLKIPIQTLKVGSLGVHRCLGLAKAKGARITIASTSEIYGDPEVHPQHEDYWGHVNTVGPRGVYDEAKRFQEAITMAYHTFHGLETRIVRIFNTYGPRMRLNDGRVLPATAGIWLTKSARLFVGEVFWISCCVSTVSGVGAWKPSRTMRVPVTTTSGPAGSGPVVGSGVWTVAVLLGCVCAVAGTASASAARLLNPKRKALRRSNCL